MNGASLLIDVKRGLFALEASVKVDRLGQGNRSGLRGDSCGLRVWMIKL